MVKDHTTQIHHHSSQNSNFKKCTSFDWTPFIIYNINVVCCSWIRDYKVRKWEYIFFGYFDCMCPCLVESYVHTTLVILFNVPNNFITFPLRILIDPTRLQILLQYSHFLYLKFSMNFLEKKYLRLYLFILWNVMIYLLRIYV